MAYWFRPSRRQGDRSIRRIHARRRPLVEILEGRQLLSTFQVTSLSNSGTGTLRQAILSSNATTGTTTNSITFDLAKSGTQTISLSSALPKITHSVDIDGTTEPGYSGTPLVVINGTKATKANEASIGLEVQANGSTFKGLVIDAFNGGGVILDGASGDSGDSIANDYIGVPEAGISGADDGGFAVQLTDGAHNNSVTQDVVSNNDDGAAVHLNHSSYGNLIAGNKIGTDPTGTKSLPNGGSGVIIDLGSYNNTVGGTTAGAANVISGNKDDGVHIEGPNTYGNLVEGNFIGTDVTGTKSLPNGDSGVEIQQSNSNTIGGSTAGARNVISGNLGDGVDVLDGSNDNLVEGNYVGTDVTGEHALANSLIGVMLDSSSHNTVGGTVAGARNVISGNDELGVKLTDETATKGGMTDNLVEGNYIGTDALGTKALANQDDGLLIDYGSDGNTIGGTIAGARNVISGNVGSGVALSTGLTGQPVSSNLVEGNYVGTTAGGNVALHNGHDGVKIAGSSHNTIGGTAAGAGNVVSGNAEDGVYITNSVVSNGTTYTSSDNVVQGNLIGWTGLGNTGSGVHLDDSSAGNTIGGTTAAAGNTIEGNGSNGVYLNAVGLGNAVGYDFIESNGGDGVFLYDTSLATTVTYCTIELNAGDGILMEHSYTLVTSTDTVIKNVKGQIVQE